VGFPSDFHSELREVTVDDLASSSQLAGTGFKVTDPDLSDKDVALRGDYQLVRLRSGLILHATDTYDTHDLTNEILQHAGITCSIFLRGRVAVRMGDRQFEMGPGTKAWPRDLEGTVISRSRPERFVRCSRRGTHIRKVNVTVSPEWLERDELGLGGYSTAISRFAADHLNCVRWKPSARLVSIAEQILNPPPYATILRDLYLESRAIEIVAEAMHAISNPDPFVPNGLLKPREHRRLANLREYLVEHMDDTLTLNVIAREAGMSANTLQRLFQMAYGVTVFEYVRRLKLQRARQAIEREGVSVTEAAHIAGYTSAANFSTAFKRLFGVSPKTVRSTF